ncbi:MAG: hypothetical protein C0432_02895 [Candidatus Puniceispirillum sp.]|nr:hypothetical protein [Candidatus Pelagibacter sp.]MBA4283223.1 hypothetical protein [Candidatus Puniceispirillum sp.]
MFYRLFIFFIFLYPLYASEQKVPISRNSVLTFDEIIKILETKKDELNKIKNHKDLKNFTCLPLNLKKGQKDPLVPKIRKKLLIRNYIQSSDVDSDLYDLTIENGIKQFQEDNSIDNDGVFGMRTCLIFNQSESALIQQIEKTIHKIKEENIKEKKRKIIVNAGTYQAFTVDVDGTIDHIQAAVLGMKTRQTPLMDSKISQIVLNPYWGVPSSILFKDKLKKIIANPNYLDELQYQVFDSSNREVDAEDIDWAMYTEKNFPYYIRQKPGKYNALGNIKFILNNKNAIYMHGSPEEKDFKRKERTFSSGCIRLEYPIDIAIWILKGTSYSEERIESFLDEEKTVYIDLNKKIEAHVVAWPVFINEDRQVIFGNSFYTEDVKK